MKATLRLIAMALFVVVVIVVCSGLLSQLMPVIDK